MNTPLALKLRPKTIDDVIGQKHLVGENSVEKKFLLYDDEKSKKEYQELMIFIFLILLIVYYYFAQDGYNKIMELNENDSNKKKVLSYAAFIGSFLILISGIIFLYILIVDNEIETEIAFS